MLTLVCHTGQILTQFAARFVVDTKHGNRSWVQRLTGTTMHPHQLAIKQLVALYTIMLDIIIIITIMNYNTAETVNKNFIHKLMLSKSSELKKCSKIHN